MNPQGNRHIGRFAAIITTLGLFCSVPAIGLADPSNTNHGSDSGIANAGSTGSANSNVNGIGAPTGTAPVPETSTYVAMATLLAAAAYARHRRRVAHQ